MTTHGCPSEQQLEAFQLGDLPEPSLSDLAKHLEHCAQCETRAQRLDGVLDPLLGALRGALLATPLPSALGSRPSPVPSASRPAAAGAAYPFLAPPTHADELGRLGNYRVHRLLGKGGMAFVFEAEDVALQRSVALKVMKPDLPSDAEGWQRLLREARIMAAIKHEHLVTVYQAGQEGNVVYLAMELLHGESLGARLERRHPEPVAEILRLAREIASGLAVVHRHGLVHRDLKPDNIWLEGTTGRVKILDFGLARCVRDDVQLTRTGIVMGTPAYMAPEQARAETVDHRSDLFSLGCIMYVLCTGRRPFQAENTMAVLTALAVEQPASVQELNPALPAPLAELVMQLLAKNPEQRPQTAEAVLDCLAAISRGDRLPAATITRSSVPTRLRRRVAHGWKRWALAGLAAGTLALLAFLMRNNAAPRGPAPPVYASVPGAFYLSDMEELEPENWPFPGRIPDQPCPEPADWPAPKGGIRTCVKGKCSLHGIWTHMSPGGAGIVSVSYRLGKNYDRFHAEVALNDGPRSCSPLTFAVYGNGTLLWKSKPVSAQADAQSCSFSVAGIDKLKLEVSGSGEVRGTHGVWIEPYLTK